MHYGVKFTNAFVFEQMARYLTSEALDVCDKHAPMLSKIIHQPNPDYIQVALAVAIVADTALATTVAVPTSVILTTDQMTAATLAFQL